MVLAHEFFDALPINIFQVRIFLAKAIPGLTGKFPFQKTEDGWREIFVNIDPEYTSPSTAEPQPTVPTHHAQNTPSTQPTSGLTLALSREPSTLSSILPATSPRFDKDVPVGGRVEISKDSFETMRMVGQLISGVTSDAPEESATGAGGAGLVIDYGADGLSSNSFRVSLVSRSAL